MPGCLPPRYRLLDLAFALLGTATFLVDLGSDVWSAVWYYKAGDTAWALLVIGFYVLSSSVLQLLSWGWFWVDRQDWDLQREAEEQKPGNGDIKEPAPCAQQICGDYVECYRLQAAANQTSNGGDEHCNKWQADASQVTGVGTAVSVVDAVPIGKAEPQVSALHSDTATTNGDPAQDTGTLATLEELSARGCSCTDYSASGSEDEPVLRRFWTSKIILWPSCFTLLHLLQLGYPLRCIHSLEVGIAAYRNPGEDLFKDYAFFLTHDISMMRLVETFLENTPQLILVLYIILQREVIQTFQYFSISVSFICISWAILDYHQSLRLFLKEKHKLTIFSSAAYYLWNFCLISSRILCITLFTVTFHWWIAIHFLLLWSAFFLWANLQKTTFMKHSFLEIVYRAAVAIILYFSWFNIADGRTIYRCIVYNVFIIIDSGILLVSWVQCKFPSVLDGYETHIIVTNTVFFAVGLLLRLLYYKCLHPNVFNETKQYFDVPDGKGTETNKLPSAEKTGQQEITNDRMKYFAERDY
ncbi:XK-related protein 8 [Leptodactylus fuscus]|uniref:XK-related protein 8 n=1 Tax=Leptodactylus fuscus TaxID=238119 RepID=UPI003F4F368D